MNTNKFLGCSIALGLTLTMIVSCESENNNTVLSPIGGYNSADEIGADDLVGYWPFNGDGTEVKSNTSPSATVGATYEDAIKGKGITFTNGYLAYPEIEAMGSTIPNMSISLWGKFYNNGVEGHSTMVFSLDRPGNWAGNMNLMAETGLQPTTSDTLTIKGLVQIKKEDGTVNEQEITNKIKATEEEMADGHTPFANRNSGVWAHYVLTWEESTGSFKIYANGIKISNAKFESKNEGNALPLNFFTPTKPIIGTYSTVVSGIEETWQQSMTGQLDEIRVWKKALSATEITALYELEKAGR